MCSRGGGVLCVYIMIYISFWPCPLHLPPPLPECCGVFASEASTKSPWLHHHLLSLEWSEEKTDGVRGRAQVSPHQAATGQSYELTSSGQCMSILGGLGRQCRAYLSKYCVHCYFSTESSASVEVIANQEKPSCCKYLLCVPDTMPLYCIRFFCIGPVRKFRSTLPRGSFMWRT